MELKKPNALSIYGLFIPLNRQYKGEMRTQNIHFLPLCELLKALPIFNVTVPQGHNEPPTYNESTDI